MSAGTPLKIASGDIYDVWWSPDSETLFYGVSGQGNFAYILENASTKMVPVEEILSQTARPALAQDLPSVFPYPFPFVAPSGQHALFVTPINLPPTPTTNPNIEGGESLYPSNDLQLWIYENGERRRVGNIHVCSIDSIPHWSPDARKVVIVESGFQPPQCYDTYLLARAYLVDFDEQTLEVLFPAAASEGPLVQLYGFSPDGQFLLHGFYSDTAGANLALLDIESGESESIDAPVHSFEGWISNHKLLVLYRDESLSFSPPFPLGILNLKTLSVTSLTDMFPDVYIGHVAISPNKEWLAFAAGTDQFSYDSLWLLHLELD